MSRLVGRLPVGRKLMLIYLLDLTAVIYVSSILIHEKYIAIDFARKEVAGLAYIGKVREALLAVPLPAGSASSASSKQPLLPTQLGTWLDDLDGAERRYGPGMKSADSNEALQSALETAGAIGRLDEPGYARVLDAGRNLITRIGNQSNLILDPDLDSYYTMSLIMLRFPELHELLARTAQKAVQVGQTPPAARDAMLTEMLILEGRVDAVVKGINADYEEAFTAGPPALRVALTPSREALAQAVSDFRAIANQPDPDDSAQRLRTVLASRSTASERLLTAWRSAGTGLGELLQARVDLMFSRMWLHLGTAAALLGVILGLVYFVARQISQPIRRLAGVADTVSRSGDYSMRASHDSRDEIGQLVRAFNSMLGELDHDRASREELAATASAEEAQRALLESFPIPLIVTSIPDHRVLHANQPALPWLEGLQDDPWVACLEPAARARFFQRLSDIGQVDGYEVHWQSRPQEGASVRKQWALLSARRLTYRGQPALLTSFTPIGQIKLLEQRLQLWAKVFEASSESIVIFDVERQILTANQAFSRTTGYDGTEVIGQKPDFLYSDRHDAAYYETMWQGAVIRGFWQGEVWFKRKNGEVFPTWMVANAVRNPDGRISHLVAASVDISEHKANEQRIHHLAHHDVLTDLPNRSLCLERLRMAVEQASRSGLHVGVVFIDLDRFKNVNDSMGHHVGDALLRSVSRRLLQVVRAGDTVSRLGGDEFVVVINGIGSVDEIAEIVSDRMLPLIRQPHPVEGVELTVGCSAGIAVYPQHGRDIDHLMRNADAAMYQAKAAGRNHALFFTAEFHEQARERLEIENALRHVVERGELRLHYQPRIETRSGDVIGVEALVRWQHPEQGLISPARFISIAEETGQIVPIGAWILGEACRQHSEWQRSGLGRIPMSVNVSAVQLRDHGLSQTLAAALREHAVSADVIELELTETFLVENALATVESLQKLKAIGVSLSIDDFGTGYSSLNYLHQFPIDKLKIDQSFVRDMLDDPADLAITQAIIGLGHTLGLRVVAEGVERVEEEALLREAGCDELQGFLYAKPMPPEQFEAWLAGRSIAKPTPARPRPLPRSPMIAAPRTMSTESG